MSEGSTLIVRVGAMGDVVHALPAVAALRKQRPGAEIGWVVDPRWAPLLIDELGGGPLVSRVHLAETKLWSRAPFSAETAQSVAGLRRELRARRYGRVVDMQGTLRSAVIGRFARAARFAGFEDPREPAAKFLYRERFSPRGAHVVEQGAALLGDALGAKLEPTPPELARTVWAEHWAEDLVGAASPCVLAASAGWGAKQWPIQHYAELARRLRQLGFRVIANAPRKDDPLAGRLAQLSGGAAQAVVCNVAGLIALLRRSAVVVGGDSGPVHVAAALGVPVVGLYGPTDPARNGPWGPGPKKVLRHRSSATSHKRVQTVDPGLVRIGPEEVVAAVAEVLDG